MDATQRIRVDVRGQVIEITREERDELLEELCFVAGCKEIREKLEAVTATWTLVLDASQRARLRVALAIREGEVALPDGLARLLAALESEATLSAVPQR